MVTVNNSITLLNEGLQKLSNNFIDLKEYPPGNSFDDSQSVNIQVKEQLDFIYKISFDIKKITGTISS